MGQNRTPSLSPSLSPAIPLDLQRVIRRLEGQINLVHTRLDEHGAALGGKLGSSDTDLMRLAGLMRDRLQSNGPHPLNIAGLPGIAAQPQKASAPALAMLPVAAQLGSLVMYNNALWRFGASRWQPVGAAGETSGTGTDGSPNSALTIAAPHANRGDYPAPSYSDGTLYFETDRNVFYVNVAGTWMFGAGLMLGTAAIIPADLAASDVGFAFFATDTSALSFWTGAAWQIATPPPLLVIGFTMPSGAVGTDVGPVLAAPHAGTLSKCVFATKASDPATALTFTITRNGVAVFTANNTVAAGTASQTATVFTNLVSPPIAVNQHDIFTLNIIGGSNTWNFTVQLET